MKMCLDFASSRENVPFSFKHVITGFINGENIIWRKNTRVFDNPSVISCNAVTFLRYVDSEIDEKFSL